MGLERKMICSKCGELMHYIRPEDCRAIPEGASVPGRLMECYAGHLKAV